MKKLTFFVLLIILSLNLYCAVIDYSMIPPHTLPEYTGQLNDPDLKVVYEDESGLYIIVIYGDTVYVYYL